MTLFYFKKIPKNVENPTSLRQISGDEDDDDDDDEDDDV